MLDKQAVTAACSRADRKLRACPNQVRFVPVKRRQQVQGRPSKWMGGDAAAKHKRLLRLHPFEWATLHQLPHQFQRFHLVSTCDGPSMLPATSMLSQSVQHTLKDQAGPLGQIQMLPRPEEHSVGTRGPLHGLHWFNAVRRDTCSICLLNYPAFHSQWLVCLQPYHSCTGKHTVQVTLQSQQMCRLS